MAIPCACTGDLAKGSVGYLLAQEEVLGISPHEVAGREEHSGLIERIGHGVAVLGGDAQRLLDEGVLLGLGGTFH